MSEHLQSADTGNINNELRDLETALSDPFISEVLRNAAQYNEIMSIHPVSFAEAVSIIEDLDSQWGVLFDNNVTITGNVTFLSPDGERQTHFYEEQKMVSKGFTMLNKVDEDELNEGCRVGLQLYMEIPDELKEAYAEVTEGTHLVGSAEIDHVEIQAEAMSYERATAWLSVFEPELIENVDATILNSKYDDVRALLELSETELRVNFDSDDKLVALRALSAYLKKIVKVDYKLPYLAEISGELLIKNNEGIDVFGRIGTGEWLVFVHDIVAIQATKAGDVLEGSPQRTQVYLQSTIINPLDEGEDLPARIPIDSLVGIEPIRSLV